MQVLVVAMRPVSARASVIPREHPYPQNPYDRVGLPLHTAGIRFLWAIEGTGSYDALLAGCEALAGYRMVEALMVSSYAPARRRPGETEL